jgi:hypothetical protein
MCSSEVLIIRVVITLGEAYFDLLFFKIVLNEKFISGLFALKLLNMKTRNIPISPAHMILIQDLSVKLNLK